MSRLIACLPVIDGMVVKSYSYQSLRPSISLEVALDTLDSWLVDEIVVLDVSRQPGLSARTLSILINQPLLTPLSYGGSIRGLDEVLKLHEAGVERFVLEHLAFEDLHAVADLASEVGSQALVASIPCRIEDSVVMCAPTGRSGQRPAVSFLAELESEGLFSEYFIIDEQAEGRSGAFDYGIPESLNGGRARSLIWFGGIDNSAARSLAQLDVTAAIAIGNRVFESENPFLSIRGQ